MRFLTGWSLVRGVYWVSKNPLDGNFLQFARVFREKYIKIFPIVSIQIISYLLGVVYTLAVYRATEVPYLTMGH